MTHLHYWSAVLLISLLVVSVISSGVTAALPADQSGGTGLDAPAGTDPAHRPGHMASVGGSHYGWSNMTPVDRSHDMWGRSTWYLFTVLFLLQLSDTLNCEHNLNHNHTDRHKYYLCLSVWSLLQSIVNKLKTFINKLRTKLVLSEVFLFSFIQWWLKRKTHSLKFCWFSVSEQDMMSLSGFIWFCSYWKC